MNKIIHTKVTSKILSFWSKKTQRKKPDLQVNKQNETEEPPHDHILTGLCYNAMFDYPLLNLLLRTGDDDSGLNNV